MIHFFFFDNKYILIISYLSFSTMFDFKYLLLFYYYYYLLSITILLVFVICLNDYYYNKIVMCH